MNIYLVCNNDIEDGSPMFAFSDKAVALALVRAGVGGHIVTMPLDENEDAIRAGRLPFQCVRQSFPDWGESIWAYLNLDGEPHQDRYRSFSATAVEAATIEEAIETAKAGHTWAEAVQETESGGSKIWTAQRRPASKEQGE